LLALCGLLPTLQASEGGGHNVATGALTSSAGYMPPPGTTIFAGYLLWLRAGSVRDEAGNSTTPEFRADLVAHAGRFLHTWTPTWHGLNFTSGIVYVVDYSKVKTGPDRDENVDLSDIDIEPLYLSWSWGKLHLMTGPNIWVPMGKYAPNDPANASVHYGHYITYIYEVGLTWQPLPNIDISCEPTVSRNQRNLRTQYHSGDLFSFDAGATIRPFPSLPQLGLGVGGFYFKQLSNDRQDGVVVPDRKIDEVAFGPQASWAFTPATQVILKWQHEYHVVNAARGDLVWLEWSLPIDFSAHRPPTQATHPLEPQ
jgi:hypothetical protein